jgi:hypothetical protein
MSLRQLIVVAALLLTAFLVGARAIHAQQFLTLEQPTVVAGPDVGFRVERMDRGIPVGKLVVKVNGRWVDAEIGGGAVQAVR